jgi:hypothetical protein
MRNRWHDTTFLAKPMPYLTPPQRQRLHLAGAWIAQWVAPFEDAGATVERRMPESATAPAYLDHSAPDFILRLLSSHNFSICLGTLDDGQEIIYAQR